MMVTVKVRLDVMVLEEIVIASEIVMVNVSVRENKMVSVTENVRENVIVTENVTVSMKLMVPVMEKGCHVWKSLLPRHCTRCHCKYHHPCVDPHHHSILNHHHFHQTSTQDHQYLHWKLSGTPAGL